MKKLSLYLSFIVTGLFMVACSEDFKDWIDQKTYEPEAAVTIPGFTATPGAPVDLNTAGDSVKLLSINEAALPAGSTLDNLRIVVTPEDGNGEKITIKAYDTNGMFPYSELQSAVVTYYGVRPTPRVLNAHAYVNVMRNGEAAYVDIGTFNITITPKAPAISPAYYIVGGPNDWATSAAEKPIKFSHSGADVYEDPIFTAIFDAAASGDTWFAIGDDNACAAIGDGDWSKLLGIVGGNSQATEGQLDFRYNMGADNSFCVPEGPKKIKVTLNMLEYTFKVEAVNIAEAYYLIGGPGEWNAESAMTMPFSHSTKDVIEDPVFNYTFASTGGEMWFAFGDKEAIDAVGAGTWNKLFGTKGDSKDLSGSFDRRYNLDGDHSFCVDGSAKFYRFTVNMAEMTYTITPLNFSEYFYEIGNESGWSTAHALYGPSGDGKYQGFYYLDGEFKFKPNENDWNDDLEYVSGSADNLSGSLQSSGGPNCPDPGAGFYRVDLDAANLTYNLKKIEYVSIIGTANGNWDTDTDLTYNKTENCWEVTCDLNAGEMKFRGNHNWDGDVDLGGSFDNLVHGGSNIAVEAGNYTIKLYISIAGKHKAVVTKN